MAIFRIWKDKKLIVLSSPKVASSFLDTLFLFESGDKNIFSINDKFQINKVLETEIDNSFEDLDLIFSNKNKKDILFLYRSPQKKYLSGLIQDFNGMLSNDTHSNNFLIDYHFNSNPRFKDFFDLKAYEIKELIDTSSAEKEPEFFEYYTDLLEIYLKFHINNNISTNHGTPTLYLTYSIINEKIKDTNKLYLLDIDQGEPDILVNFLSKYEIEPKRKININSNKNGITLINNILKENQYLKQKLGKNLSSERTFYNLLRKNNNNIYDK